MGLRQTEQLVTHSSGREIVAVKWVTHSPQDTCTVHVRQECDDEKNINKCFPGLLANRTVYARCIINATGFCEIDNRIDQSREMIQTCARSPARPPPWRTVGIHEGGQDVHRDSECSSNSELSQPIPKVIQSKNEYISYYEYRIEYGPRDELCPEDKLQ
ncbi:hypothetical protein F2P81_005282 [Scophthalmus maximus]|uniref:Uncharacterized protein n=1 Tax=Scophthalmus maximus TaxID=52904 RepID=A0A6A4TD55_SCOMX|nr:hypothetical protein F2P81_005282 [Scophthalmus maximus]